MTVKREVVRQYRRLPPSSLHVRGPGMSEPRQDRCVLVEPAGQLQALEHWREKSSKSGLLSAERRKKDVTMKDRVGDFSCSLLVAARVASGFPLR